MADNSSYSEKDMISDLIDAKIAQCRAEIDMASIHEKFGGTQRTRRDVLESHRRNLKAWVACRDWFEGLESLEKNMTANVNDGKDRMRHLAESNIEEDWCPDCGNAKEACDCWDICYGCSEPLGECCCPEDTVDPFDEGF